MNNINDNIKAPINDYLITSPADLNSSSAKTSQKINEAKNKIFTSNGTLPVLEITASDYALYLKALEKIVQGVKLENLPEKLKQAYQKVINFQNLYQGRLAQAQSIARGNVKKKWTVIYYAAGANDLDEALNQTIQSLKEINDFSQMNIAIKQARLKKEGSGAPRGTVNDYILIDLGIKTPPELFKIYPNFLISPPEGARGAEENMGEQKTFEKFLISSMKNYPAEHYLIIVDDHGSGHEGVAQDDNYNGDRLTLLELEKALKKAEEKNGGKPIDGLFFDACLMSSAEVISQLNGEIKTLIASEKLSQTGFPSAHFLSNLKNYDDLEAFAHDLVKDKNEKDHETYETIAAINLEKVPAFEGKLLGLSKLIINLEEVKDKKALKELKKIVSQSEGADKNSYIYSIAEKASRIDLDYFLEKIIYNSYLRKNYPELIKSAENAKGELKNLIIAERHREGELGGVSIYLPPNLKQGEEPYSKAYDLNGRILKRMPNGKVIFEGEELNFVKTTRWDEVILKLSQKNL
ncbi:MAG: hypothetical protein HYU63_09585 [Armatimonadetes bacterium]|nr:hypothetical protein [Armatimonadota bacterium]